jgi:hypothetical protein
VESTVVKVLIVKGLGENGFCEMVTWVGLNFLLEFEGPRGEGA